MSNHWTHQPYRPDRSRGPKGTRYIPDRSLPMPEVSDSAKEQLRFVLAGGKLICEACKQNVITDGHLEECPTQSCDWCRRNVSAEGHSSDCPHER